MLVLKNNKGTEDNRVRPSMDYGVQFNKLMYERLIEGGNITLFNDVTKFMMLSLLTQDKFKELYEAAERKLALGKSSIPVELFSNFVLRKKRHR